MLSYIKSLIKKSNFSYCTRLLIFNESLHYLDKCDQREISRPTFCRLQRLYRTKPISTAVFYPRLISLMILYRYIIYRMKERYWINMRETAHQTTKKISDLHAPI